MPLRRRAIGRATIVGVVAAIIVISVAVFVVSQASPVGPTTHSPNPGSSSSCSGYPPNGDCLAIYSYAFTVSVNYTGHWELTYQGYNSLSRSNPTNVTGSYSGTGFYSVPITVKGLNNNGLTLCAQAQKLDGSSATLILSVMGSNQTSTPFGEVTYCGTVVP